MEASEVRSLIHVAGLAYVLGGLVFSYWLPKIFKGEDVRDYGSGNVGGTNVWRAFRDWRLALACIFFDVGKGTVAVLVVKHFFRGSESDIVLIVATIFVVLGHCRPWALWGSHGGKGVATSAGALMAITPWLVLVMLVVFVAIVAKWRFISVGSLAVAALYPLCVTYFNWGRGWIVGMAWLLAVLVWVMHRSNVVRLIKHEEPKIELGGR